MREIEGRFLRQRNGKPFAAIVSVRIDTESLRPGISLDLHGAGFRSQGILESAPPTGPYEDWRAAAVAGASFAIAEAGQRHLHVTITRIEGRAGVDTTAATVAAAAANAVWKAMSVEPRPEALARLEAAVWPSWSNPELVPVLE